MIYLIFIFLFATINGVEADPSETIQEAYASYQSGEKASTISQRKEAFNHALALYTQLAESNPTYGDGKLYYNIANTYFQLGEYPWAIFYYYRALSLRPTDEKVKHNLNVSLKKLNLSQASEPTAFQNLIFFHTYFSLPERLQLFFILGLIVLACASVYIWQRQKWLAYALLGLALCWLAILLSVGYTRYFSPIEGVVVNSTALYKDAGEQYAKASDQPILGGVKVRVLDILPEGKWLKIYTPSGEVGYVPFTVIRVI